MPPDVHLGISRRSLGDSRVDCVLDEDATVARQEILLHEVLFKFPKSNFTNQISQIKFPTSGLTLGVHVESDVAVVCEVVVLHVGSNFRQTDRQTDKSQNMQLPDRALHRVDLEATFARRSVPTCQKVSAKLSQN